METSFTPWASLGGGMLIGLASVMLLGGLGRIMGATGILTGFIKPFSREDWMWRAFVLLGFVSGPLVFLLMTGRFPTMQVPASAAMMVLGGFLVGMGVSYGGGCTSGHGICGNARFSARSIVATITFMISTFITVFIVRHVLGF